MLFRSGVSPIRLFLPALSIALLVAGCDRDNGASGQGALPQASLHEYKGASEPKVDPSRKGQQASAAPFLGPDDAAVTVRDFRGKPVLLNLWATWCAPCLKEMPSLDRLAVERGDTLTVLAVAQDIQGATTVDPWFQKAGLTALQPYLDPQNNLLAAYNSALPVTILFDAEGREVWRVTGAVDWQGATARMLLDDGLK